MFVWLINRYSARETCIAYWGMGLYWGKASSNNKKGHMIGHIKDIGHDPNSPLTRLYATHAAQPFHNDSSGEDCWEMCVCVSVCVGECG